MSNKPDDIRIATPPREIFAVDLARFRKAPCYLCGYNGEGYFSAATHPCADAYHRTETEQLRRLNGMTPQPWTSTSTTVDRRVAPGYESLARVLDAALEQAQAGKGVERHAGKGEAFEDQQIVQLGEWMDSTAFAIGQACKKSLESTRLPTPRARAELLGAINYLAAAVLMLDRRDS